MSKKLAQHLCKRYIDDYPNDVLVAGIYGSYAKGKATPTSDLELVIITQPGCLLKERTFLLQQLPVGIFVSPLDKLEAIVSVPSLRWPFQMGVLAILEVLEGDGQIIEHLLELGRAIPSSSFKKELSRVLPKLVWESHGRIHSCITRNDFGALHLSAVEVLCEMKEALCLLNQSWVTNDYLGGLRDSYEFELLPKGWAQLVEAIWWEREPTRVAQLTDELVENFTTLLAKEGIAIRRLASIDELVL